MQKPSGCIWVKAMQIVDLIVNIPGMRWTTWHWDIDRGDHWVVCDALCSIAELVVWKLLIWFNEGYCDMDVRSQVGTCMPQVTDDPLRWVHGHGSFMHGVGQRLPDGAHQCCHQVHAFACRDVAWVATLHHNHRAGACTPGALTSLAQFCCFLHCLLGIIILYNKLVCSIVSAWYVYLLHHPCQCEWQVTSGLSLWMCLLELQAI